MSVERLLSALEAARGDTVRDWAIFAGESRRLSLGIKDRQPGNPHAPLGLAESCGAGYLIVWSDGTLSRGSLERAQLDDDVDRTLAYVRTAAYDDPDAAHVLGASPVPDVELHDPATAAMAAGDTTLLSQRLAAVRERVADPAFRTWSGSFSFGESRSRLVTSAGFDAESTSTSCGWFVSLNGELGSGHGARAPESDEEFVGRVERLMRIVRALQPAGDAMDGGVVPVILHPRVVEDYALSTLLHHLGGSTVAHDEGRFHIDQFGSNEAVLRDDLTLRLAPLEPLSGGSYRFTSEGVPAAPCVYLERGRLVQPLLGVKYARRLKLEPNPTPASMRSLRFEGPTPLAWDDALAAASGGALVLSVLGVHTQDSASGDFSLAAPQVLRISDNGFAGRIRGTISGNLFEVLRDPGLQFVDFEGEHTPGLLFSCRFDPS